MREEKILIPGPAGPIEAVLLEAGGPAVAVLCHPHPLYGGTMDDPVLGILARALTDAAIGVLRFNFRGVGGSGGEHDGGAGEVEDLRAVLGWLRTARPGVGVWLGGYSFGAAVVGRWLAEGNADPERALLIAPPVGSLAIPPPDGSVPVDVFAGDADAFLDRTELATWTGAHVHVLEGADHFFTGRWDDLQRSIQQALPPRASG